MKSARHPHVLTDNGNLPEPRRESPTAVAIAIFVGGFLGGVLRYSLDTLAASAGFHDLPAGTFAANVSGSFLIGFFVGLIIRHENVPLIAHSGITIGLLGGYTTFSIFSLQLMVLLENGRVLTAIGYATATLSLSLLAVWLGQHIGRAVRK